MTVNPGDGEDSPDPDAEETDVFLVMGADRRARKTREEGPETPWAGENTGSSEFSTASETSPDPVAPEAAQEHGSALHRGASPSAPEPEAAEPGHPEGTDPSAEGPEPVRPDTDTVRVQAPPTVDPADSSDPAAPVAGTGIRPAGPEADGARGSGEADSSDTGGGAASHSPAASVASVPDAGTGEPLPEDSGPVAPARPADAPPEAGTAVSGPAPREAGSAEAAGPPSPGAGRGSAPPGAGEPGQAAPYFTYGGRSPEPTGFPDIPAAPYAGAGQPEPGRGVPRTEGRLDPPTPYAPAANAQSTQAPAQAPSAQPPSAQSPSAQGIESWIDAVGDVRTPVQGGYEQRIAAVRSVPASPWRRAVFAVTGGRLNLG
ncbi:hypothetical protein [Nocardiopsis sp. HUAS JQ3]|uniref:hypothetical protein n=1 Tax=Nocardiopsis sp. HUAS JQ3 TaxID=3061629 RepID=UPI0023A9F52F|nr:hypothetical protein [Nocardiopsis sp. HUAS JQ3]WDZ90745.1 hypothetical protein PV789_28360 [Nocardiopsis sp. HUAS JQ3]